MRTGTVISIFISFGCISQKQIKSTAQAPPNIPSELEANSHQFRFDVAFASVENDDDGHEKIRLLREQTPLINDDHIDVDCESIDVFGKSNLNSGAGA